MVRRIITPQLHKCWSISITDAILVRKLTKVTNVNSVYEPSGALSLIENYQKY